VKKCFTIFNGKGGRFCENIGTQYQVFVTATFLFAHILMCNSDPINAFLNKSTGRLSFGIVYSLNDFDVSFIAKYGFFKPSRTPDTTDSRMPLFYRSLGAFAQAQRIHWRCVQTSSPN
jgi:hypothetical protein